MPAERRGGDARFDESDDDDEFEGFSATDIEASADRIRNRQLSPDFIRESDDDFDVSEISSLDSGSDADGDDNDDSIYANDPGKSPGYTVCDCSVGCCQLGILQFTLGCRTVHALLHGVHSAGDCHGDEHICWPVYAEPTKD